MESIKSTKVSLKIPFIIAYSVLAVLLVTIFSLSVKEYLRYKEGQDFAIVTTMMVTDEYDKIDDRERLIEKIYDDLNPPSYRNWDLYYAAKEADKSLGEILEEAGYDCFYGSEYLRHTNYFSHFVLQEPFTGVTTYAILIIWSGLLVILAVITVIYLINRKTGIELNDDIIICRKASGKYRQIMLRHIESVEIIAFHGLKIEGGGIKHKLFLIDNNEEIKCKIVEEMSKMTHAAPATASTPQSISDELKKYKELLDMGIITQEEFDKKKKELLGF